MGLIYSPSAKAVRGFSPNEMYVAQLIPVQTTFASGGATTPIHDYISQAPSGVARNVFKCSLADSFYYPGTTWVNNSPNVVRNVFTNQTATWLSDGIASITVINPILGNQTMTFQVSSTGAFSVFNSYANASLAKALVVSIETAISGKSWGLSSTVTFLSTDFHTNATRNASLWCSGLVDLSGIPFGGTSPSTPGVFGVPLFSGALISPNHMLSCNHAQQSVGNTLYFLGSDGVHAATILGSGNVPGTDIQVYYLGNAAGSVAINSAVDTTKVKPFSVMPANFASSSGSSYLSSLGQYGSGVINAGALPYPAGWSFVPLMYYNQYQEVLLMEIQSFPTSNECSYVGCTETTPSNRAAWSQSPSAVAAGRTPYTYGPISGDSGSPIFTVVPNDATLTPVLIGAWHSGNSPSAPGSGSAPNVTANISAIQSLMQSLAVANSSGTDTTAYTLTQANLSAYPLYS